jgi:hypothetical protein
VQASRLLQRLIKPEEAFEFLFEVCLQPGKVELVLDWT